MKLEVLNCFNFLKFFYQQFYMTNTHMCREGPWCTCKLCVLCLTRGSWRNHISSIKAVLPFNRSGGFLSWNKWVWFIFPWTNSAGKPLIFLMSQTPTSTKVSTGHSLINAAIASSCVLNHPCLQAPCSFLFFLPRCHQWTVWRGVAVMWRIQVLTCKSSLIHHKSDLHY